MIISKAPVRISFGGGGTDLPAYFQEHGGAVLSTTITKYNYAVLTESAGELAEIISADYHLHCTFDVHGAPVSRTDVLAIPKNVFRRYGAPNGLSLFLKSEVPSGSGLGLSGSVTVNLVNALSAFQSVERGKAEIAQEASAIEIGMMGRPIGLQDQYASAFGGLNFMEFTAAGTTVTPVRLPEPLLAELERNCLLFFLNQQRDSASILQGIQAEVKGAAGAAVEVLHQLKQSAHALRDALEAGDLRRFAALLDVAWQLKKQLSTAISNPFIEACYQAARAAGALGGKVTGAGGGGYLLIYAEPEAQAGVRRSLQALGLQPEADFRFDRLGVQTLMSHQDRLNASLSPEGYLLGLETIIRRIDNATIDKIVDAVFAAYGRDGKLFLMGNGGSAATASHAICDLSKTTLVPNGKPIKVISLVDNVSLITAWANDLSFDDIYCGQLRPFLEPGDVVIGLSGSGNSKNVVKALRYAKEHGAVTIGLVGFDGGEVKKTADLTLHVVSSNYQFIEDVHMILLHLITSVLKNRVERQVAEKRGK